MKQIDSPVGGQNTSLHDDKGLHQLPNITAQDILKIPSKLLSYLQSKLLTLELTSQQIITKQFSHSYTGTGLSK